VFVGRNKDRVVWNMGKRMLGIINTKCVLQGKGRDMTNEMTILQGYTENSIVRKMVGSQTSNRLCILEISDAEDKNCTELNCFDIDIQRIVFSKKLGADDPEAISRFTKSIELSVTEEFIFSVGVYLDGSGGQGNIAQKGFINAMRLNATLKECTLMVIDSATHPEKKGMYRLHRMPHSDTIIISSWIDVFVYKFEADTTSFHHLHSFLGLHTDLIYNVIGTSEGFFTCSNDCESTFIKL
jgi:hypothetical protein